MPLLLALHTVWGRKVGGIVRAWIGPIPMFFATTAESTEVIILFTFMLSKPLFHLFFRLFTQGGLK